MGEININLNPSFMFGSWNMHHAHGNEPRRGPRSGRWGWRRPKHNIPVNIIDHEDEFEVRVHALTYPKDQIKVTVADDTLYISGTREIEGDPNPSFLLQEYPIKSFERSFELSQRVDQAGIKASHKDGVLVIKVPKIQPAQGEGQEIMVE